ncbi:hypothetical protein BU26DRAFT_182780 [Trematosphaeria pertusa]|uniref:Uncharacterized protein n=1 Tax=Trematosphaeria pertusa TaxID=390896 RepID=A0A6A6HTH2_9PLEO|nr:uncharacterized protein BU26DRAFT_182780 [Trematosphaeria pertusa]KAF2241199.1 hypothetical protein BU26DRAFT_182780 [Trematosphaeria pertusa]
MLWREFNVSTLGALSVKHDAQGELALGDKNAIINSMTRYTSQVDAVSLTCAGGFRSPAASRALSWLGGSWAVWQVPKPDSNTENGRQRHFGFFLDLVSGARRLCAPRQHENIRIPPFPPRRLDLSGPPLIEYRSMLYQLTPLPTMSTVVTYVNQRAESQRR